MSTLTFNGALHKLDMIDSTGKHVGSWSAYNNIDRQFSKTHFHGATHLQNGTYDVANKTKPTPKPVDPDGSFGSHGIIHFDYPGHPGVGVHSGKVHAPKNPGAQHATYGCIRTTDEAMGSIVTHMKTDPLVKITIVGNSETSVAAGVQKHSQLHAHVQNVNH